MNENKSIYTRENNAHFINVMQADGVYVKETLIQSEFYDESTANHNSEAIAEIMKTAPPKCTIYFPGGMYHFNGAADSGRAVIVSSGEMQSFAGDGINATFIREKSRDTETFFLMAHGHCSISDMSITSADMAEAYTVEWENEPHKTAVTFDCSKAPNLFTAGCILQNLVINSTGNDIIRTSYHRPFETAVKVRGNWLDTYCHTMWMTDVFTGFDVAEKWVGGALMGGPIRIINVHSYASNGDSGKKQRWNTFFKSEGAIMEQIEILNCMYIGSQFIRIDSAVGEDRKPSYDMVIDHNYINTVWIDAGSDETKSGIYINLPVIDGQYSRDIRFTNNSCTGRSPGDGAFFYVKGAVRGVTFADNDVSSGGADKCVYIRSTEAADGTDTGIRDVKIYGNYFRNYKNPITVGGDSKAKDDFYIDRVIVMGNQTMNEAAVERIGKVGINLSRCRSVTLTGNTLCPTLGYALTMYGCERAAVSGNIFEGFDTDTPGEVGIWLKECKDIALGTNVMHGFKKNIEQTD